MVSVSGLREKAMNKVPEILTALLDLDPTLAMVDCPLVPWSVPCDKDQYITAYKSHR